MKKQHIIGFALALIALCGIQYGTTRATSCLYGGQGGTGVCNTTSSNIGYNLYLVGVTTSGAPLYGFQANGSGGGGSSTVLHAGNPFVVITQAGANATVTPASVLSLVASPDISPSAATGTAISLTFLNPNGFTTTTIQSVLNSLSASGCLSYATSTGAFAFTCNIPATSTILASTTISGPAFTFATTTQVIPYVSGTQIYWKFASNNVSQFVNDGVYLTTSSVNVTAPLGGNGSAATPLTCSSCLTAAILSINGSTSSSAVIVGTAPITVSTAQNTTTVACATCLTTSSVNTNNTLTGNGSAASPLAIASPMTVAVSTSQVTSTNINFVTMTGTGTSTLATTSVTSLTDSGIGSALVKSTAGVFGAYAGTGPCALGTSMVTITAAGVQACRQDVTTSTDGVANTIPLWTSIDALGTSSITQNAPGTVVTIGASTTISNNLTISSLSGTQCLHEISGLVSGTGSDCGSGGGGGSPVSVTTSTLTYVNTIDSSSTTFFNANSAAAQTAYTSTIPANLLGTIGGTLRVIANGTFLNNSGSNRTLTLTMKYGGTTVVSQASGNFGASASPGSWTGIFTLTNASGTTNSQIGSFIANGTSGGGTALTPWGKTGTSAVDSTAQQPLVFQLTNSLASTTIVSSLSQIIVEYYGATTTVVTNVTGGGGGGGGPATSTMSWMIEYPGSAENDVFFTAVSTTTINGCKAVNKSPGDTVTWNMGASSSRAAATSSLTNIFAAATTTTATTTPQDLSVLATSTVWPGDPLIWYTTSGSSTAFSLTCNVIAQ